MIFSRERLLIGDKAVEKLNNSRVCIFGIGGVGGSCAETLVRCGVGNLTVFDGDTVDISNINRQVLFCAEDVGKNKVEIAQKRLKAINPNLNFMGKKLFYLPENASEIDLKGFDYIVDAVDTVSAKLEIIKRAKENNIRVVSCMGTGGKLNPSLLKVCDIEKTKVCPLSRVMRRELAKRDIKNVKVVYSEEESLGENILNEKGKKIQPSMSFVPNVAGIMLAREVVMDLIGEL